MSTTAMSAIFRFVVTGRYGTRAGYLALAWCCAAGLGAQSPARSGANDAAFNPAAYAQLLDVILPRESTSNNAFSIVVRQVGAGPERQLALRLSGDSVYAHSARVRNEPAYAAAARYKRRTGREDVKPIAALVQVEHRALNMTVAEAAMWHATLLEALETSVATLKRLDEEYRKNGSERLVLHGTQYELWYEQGAVSLHWRFIDIDPQNGDDAPLLPLSRWVIRFVSAARLDEPK